MFRAFSIRDVLQPDDQALHLSSREQVRRMMLILLCCLFYGAVMGAFDGVMGDRFLQVVYAAVKVPILLLVTFLLGLPSFWVLNRLMGLGDDFGQAIKALLTTQAALTIILASLSPFTALWYLSSTDYHLAVLFNAMMFAVASVSAQILLRKLYRLLVEKSPKHRWMLRIWIGIYAFTGIQMGWTLRPFIGDPGASVQFFRQGAFSNAYVVVARMIWDTLLHR